MRVGILLGRFGAAAALWGCVFGAGARAGEVTGTVNSGIKAMGSNSVGPMSYAMATPVVSSPTPSPSPSPSASPMPSPSPLPSNCTPEQLQEAYNLSVVQLTVPQKDIAIGPDSASGCIDGSFPTVSSMTYFTLGSFPDNRFRTTCAKRYCEKKYGTATGILPNPTQFIDGSRLNMNAMTTIECRYNVSDIPASSSGCAQVIQAKPPLEDESLTFPVPGNPCGENLYSSVPWLPQNMISCGTAYCRSLNSGFQAGILIEINTQTEEIQCSRAAFPLDFH
jgi:hypothetical protein